LSLAFDNSATVLEDTFDRLTISELSFGGHLAFQHESGFYGQLELESVDTYNVDLNGVGVDPDDSYRLRTIGLGFRTPRQGSRELFWGLGYRNGMSDEDGSEAADTVFVFWEKENVPRYGLVGVGLTTTDDSSVITVAGRHVWFGQSSVGVGLSWSIGGGRFDAPPGVTDPSIGVASIGVLMMFRPTL